MNKLPRTRGLCKAGLDLSLTLMHLDAVLKADEFPEHSTELTRCRNVLRALQTMRDDDRRAGLHRGGEPHVFRVLPDGDLLDDLPPLPTVRQFPRTSLRLAATCEANHDHDAELEF